KLIHIFVEGPSDKLAMEKLLGSIIDAAAKQGNSINFHPQEGKKPLLNNGPKKALNILRNVPESSVFLLPDLYPKNIPFSHTTFSELKNELERQFSHELQVKQCETRLKERFFVHCFKYDLEALLLASEESLMKHLDIKTFPIKWTKPVENQDHDQPPKRIIESLFKECGKKYKDTIDAPHILENSDYKKLGDICSQNFKPFINDLLRILQLDF
ncbi:MAG TPA: DUF4276 family protein, partial [Candidatus Kapabacteria bacterium]|nr:DUF4276 family protein [Candidatus Kapabacteria bacterium]